MFCFLLPGRNSRVNNNSSTSITSISSNNVNDQLSSELLSIILSYFSFEEKISVMRFVSKTWFTFCWISTDSINIDAKWSEPYVKYIVNKVIQKQTLPYLEELTVSSEHALKNDFLVGDFLIKSRKLQRLFLKQPINAFQLFNVTNYLSNLTSLYLNIHNVKNESLTSVFKDLDFNDLRPKSILLPKLKSLTLQSAHLDPEFSASILFLFLYKNILMNFSNHLQSRSDLPSIIDCNLLESLELLKCVRVDGIFEQLEKITRDYCEKELKIYGSTIEKSFRNCIPLDSLTFQFCGDVGDKTCVSSAKLFKNLSKLWFDKNKKPTELTFGVAPQSGFTGILHENNGLVSVLYQFRESLKSLKLSEFLFHTSTTPEDIPYNFTKVLSLLTSLKDIQLDLGSTNTSVSAQSVFLAQNIFEISNSIESIVLNECGDVLTQEFWDIMTGNTIKDDATAIYPNLHTLTVHSGKMYNVTSSLIRENAFPKLENITFDYCCKIESLYKDAKESSTSTFEQNEEIITTNKKQFKNITFDRCIRLKQGMNQFISMCNPKLIDTFAFLQMKECTRYDWLAKLTSVKHINLTSNINLKDDDLKYLANCEQLESLSLAHNKTLNGFGLKYLADSSRVCETMQYLNVDWCSKFEDQALEHISKFTNLRQLHILHVKILTRFDLLKSLTKLETLLLVRCFNLSDESIIPVIENCKDLKVLSLHGGHHGYNEAMSNKILKAISQNLHNIRQLTVNFAPITNDGVKLLSKLHYLSYLDVMRSKASDKILKYFPNASVALDIKQTSQ